MRAGAGRQSKITADQSNANMKRELRLNQPGLLWPFPNSTHDEATSDFRASFLCSSGSPPQVHELERYSMHSCAAH